MHILVINSGSSTVKAGLYTADAVSGDEAGAPVWQANVDQKERQIKIEVRGETKEERALSESGSSGDVYSDLIASIYKGPAAVLKSVDEIGAVGHRVVHGGPYYSDCVVVTDEVKQHIKDCAQFAPLHNPANLRGIEAAEKLLPKAKQVAVFDTAFHHNLPLPAQTYAIPLELAQKYRIRRYGFHGISNQYCAPRAAQMLGKKPDDLQAIICHLGNGCSVTAVHNGTSADTTMGFTPLDGLVMGTRSGAVDPGILIYLLKHAAHSPEELDDLLDRKSGLLGLSGESSDMREILSACDKGDERAGLAFEVFVHSLSGYIATMFARLDRCDCLVFTGGIGERAAAVRKAACQRLAFAGVVIDEGDNKDTPKDVDISASSSRTRVLVIHTQENWMIARATRDKLKLS